MDSAPKCRLIAAGMIGNILEWYDFAIYGYFAAAISLIMAAGAISFVAAWSLKETYRVPLA